MSSRLPIPMVLMRNSKEHLLMTEFSRDIDLAFGTGDRLKIADHADAMLIFGERHLKPHFAAEEQFIFPMILHHDNSPKTSLMILELTREHVLLEEILSRLLESRYAGPGLGGDYEQRLFAKYREVLRSHVIREVNDMYPLVDLSIGSIDAVEQHWLQP